MLRAILLVLLPLLAASKLTEQQQAMVDYVEKTYGPCILDGVGCPDDSFTYEKIAQSMEAYRKYYAQLLPKECRSAKLGEKAVRRCYLEFLKKFYAENTSSGKRSSEGLTEKQRAMVEYVERTYGACVRLGVGCPEGFTYEKFSQEVATYRKYYAQLLPKECSCDEASETCTRECYLATLKKFYAESVGSSKRSSDVLTDKQRAMAEYVEKTYGPCILDGVGCPDDSFTYEKIAQVVDMYRKHYASLLPSVCNGSDVTSEKATRVCYLAFLKKTYAESA